MRGSQLMAGQWRDTVPACQHRSAYAARHCRASNRGILISPVAAWPAGVARVQALRNDTLEPELVAMVEEGLAVGKRLRRGSPGREHAAGVWLLHRAWTWVTNLSARNTVQGKRLTRLILSREASR
jgi:hypothetical protein